MVIKRIYNNNVAMVEDEGVERIAIGRGITFGRSRGDELDTSAVEKVFTLDDPDSLNRSSVSSRAFPASISPLPRILSPCSARSWEAMSTTTSSSR